MSQLETSKGVLPVNGYGRTICSSWKEPVSRRTRCDRSHRIYVVDVERSPEIFDDPVEGLSRPKQH